MKDRVVCIESDFVLSREGESTGFTLPIKGEMYTINWHYNIGYKTYYVLHECGEAGFNSDCFRPIDDSFGEFIESTLMKELEYQETLNDLSI